MTKYGLSKLTIGWAMAAAVVVTIAASSVGFIKGIYAIPALVLALWLAAWFFIRPAAALYLLAAMFLLVDHWISSGDIPRQVLWLPDIVLLSFAARALFLALKRRATCRPPLSLIFTVVALGLLCVISSIINYPPDGDALIGIRAYLRWPLIFLVTLMVGLDSRVMKHVLLGIAAMAVVQLPVTASQWILTRGRTDTIWGTLSVNGTIELFMLCTYALIILLALAFRYRGPRAALITLGAAAVCFPPLFGYVRATLFVTPVLLLALLGYALLPRLGIRHWRNVLLVGVVLFASLAIGIFGVSPVKSAINKNYHGITDMSGYWYESGRPDGGASEVLGGFAAAATAANTGTAAGKIHSLLVSHSAITRSVPSRLFGLGAGYSTTHDLVRGRPDSTQAVDPKRTQLTATIADLGYLGVLALLAVYLALLRTLPRLKDDDDKFWAAIGWAAPVAVLFAIAALVYFAEWTSARATPFIFWMIVAAVHIRSRETRGQGCGTAEIPDSV